MKNISALTLALLLLGCDQYKDPTGWTVHNDTEYTFENPFTVQPDTLVQLPNNNGTAITAFAGDYGEIYDGESGRITPSISGLAGDFRLDFKVTLPDGDRKTPVLIQVDIGKSTEIVIVERTEGIENDFGVWYSVSMGFPFYCLDTFVANGGEIKITTKEPIAIANIGYFIKIDYVPDGQNQPQ